MLAQLAEVEPGLLVDHYENRIFLEQVFEVLKGNRIGAANQENWLTPVSYTHLTLPTIYSV